MTSPCQRRRGLSSRRTDPPAGPAFHFLSSLAEVALKEPQVIQNMFADNGDGTYTVRFHRTDQPAGVAVPYHVTIDNQLPTYRGAARPTTALWLADLEKAFAQLNGSWMHVGPVYLAGLNDYH